MRKCVLPRVLTRKTGSGITQFLHLIMQYYVQNLGCFESHFQCQTPCHFPCQNRGCQTAFSALFDTDLTPKHPF